MKVRLWNTVVWNYLCYTENPSKVEYFIISLFFCVCAAQVEDKETHNDKSSLQTVMNIFQNCLTKLQYVT